MLSSYPEIDTELHTREDAKDGIKSVKSRAYERHTADGDSSPLPNGSVSFEVLNRDGSCPPPRAKVAKLRSQRLISR